MTKAELIKALKDFPDEMTVLGYYNGEYERELVHIEEVEYAQPTFIGSGKKIILLRLD